MGILVFLLAIRRLFFPTQTIIAQKFRRGQKFRLTPHRAKLRCGKKFAIALVMQSSGASLLWCCCWTSCERVVSRKFSETCRRNYLSFSNREILHRSRRLIFYILVKISLMLSSLRQITSFLVSSIKRSYYHTYFCVSECYSIYTSYWRFCT